MNEFFLEFVDHKLYIEMVNSLNECISKSIAVIGNEDLVDLIRCFNGDSKIIFREDELYISLLFDEDEYIHDPIIDILYQTNKFPVAKYPLCNFVNDGVMVYCNAICLPVGELRSFISYIESNVHKHKSYIDKLI